MVERYRGKLSVQDFKELSRLLEALYKDRVD
jgi:hypothetical protein